MAVWTITDDLNPDPATRECTTDDVDVLAATLTAWRGRGDAATIEEFTEKMRRRQYVGAEAARLHVTFHH